MAGKICTGAQANNAGAGNLRSSKAYAEGAFARTKEASPSNPHLVGSPASDAWLLGVAHMAAGTVEGCVAPGVAL